MIGKRAKSITSFLVILIAAWGVWFFLSIWPFVRFAFHPFALFGGEKNYLVLFQNNYELRPTGGFISSFAILTLKNGFPTALNMEDVYGTVDDHPFVAPPDTVGRLLAHESYNGHTFRDANFYPDFPHSVVEIEKFLRKTRPFQKIDGVFAIDVTFLENWLRAVGPVSVSGYEFDADHFLEQMEELVSNVDLHNLEALANRKKGLQILGKHVALQSLVPWKLPRVFFSFQKSFNEKHALAYFHNEGLEKIVRGKNWGGVLAAESGSDFLAIVDANYGGGKSNRYVKRNIYYSLDLETGKGSLDVRYDHPGEQYIPLSTDYRAYLRAYFPADHTVAAAELSGPEDNLFFAGQTLKLPIRSQKNIHFDVSFPPSVLDQLTYRLNLWKQPGTQGDFYSVSVRVPTGMRLASEDFQAKENIATFQGFLNTDRTLSFELEKDPYAPRAISQTLRRFNEFEILWNEPIAPNSLRSKEWIIKDLNKKNPDADSVSIERTELQNGTTLKIFTKGMTLQPEEQYVLEISGVSDFSGNAIGRKTYTFFQRLQ